MPFTIFTFKMWKGRLEMGRAPIALQKGTRTARRNNNERNWTTGLYICDDGGDDLGQSD